MNAADFLNCERCQLSFASDNREDRLCPSCQRASCPRCGTHTGGDREPCAPCLEEERQS